MHNMPYKDPMGYGIFFGDKTSPVFSGHFFLFTHAFEVPSQRLIFAPRQRLRVTLLSGSGKEFL